MCGHKKPFSTYLVACDPNDPNPLNSENAFKITELENLYGSLLVCYGIFWHDWNDRTCLFESVVCIPLVVKVSKSIKLVF